MWCGKVAVKELRRPLSLSLIRKEWRCDFVYVGPVCHSAFSPPSNDGNYSMHLRTLPLALLATLSFVIANMSSAWKVEVLRGKIWRVTFKVTAALTHFTGPFAARADSPTPLFHSVSPVCESSLWLSRSAKASERESESLSLSKLYYCHCCISASSASFHSTSTSTREVNWAPSLFQCALFLILSLFHFALLIDNSICLTFNLCPTSVCPLNLQSTPDLSLVTFVSLSTSALLWPPPSPLNSTFAQLYLSLFLYQTHLHPHRHPHPLSLSLSLSHRHLETHTHPHTPAIITRHVFHQMTFLFISSLSHFICSCSSLCTSTSSASFCPVVPRSLNPPDLSLHKRVSNFYLPPMTRPSISLVSNFDPCPVLPN